MELLEALATTRAIRRYVDRPVTDDELATVLWAATRAPSGSNRQPFRFVVLRDGRHAVEARRALGDAARRMWSAKRTTDGYDAGSGVDARSPKGRLAATMDHYSTHLAEAPAIVLACLVRYRQATPFEGGSVYPACQNLLLAARAIGLGGVLTQVHLGAPDLAGILGLPEHVAIHATITLGEPAGHHGPVRRRPLGELVYEDRWGGVAPWAVDPEGGRLARPGPPARAD